MNKNELKRVMSAMGKNSAKKLTKEQRKERASKAAKARWDKVKEVKAG